MRSKKNEPNAFKHALDNLTLIASLNLEAPPQLGIFQHRFITDDEDVDPVSVLWISEEGTDEILSILDRDFTLIAEYFLSLVMSSGIDWTDQELVLTIEQTVSTAQEAAKKMDSYLAIRLETPPDKSITTTAAYRKMKEAYRQCKALWEGNLQPAFSSVQETDLLESIRQDLDYELFSICDEEGLPYLKGEILRQIQAISFVTDEGGTLEQDPLLRIREIQDRDLQASAKQMLAELLEAIAPFYKVLPKLEGQGVAQALSKALMALFLASNPGNLLHKTSKKSALQYFQDFQGFLREAMQSADYQRMLDTFSDNTSQAVLKGVHGVSYSLFMRKGGVKQEVIGLLHRCMYLGEKADTRTAIKGSTPWNQMMIEDERFRAFLRKFPNGALFKIIDVGKENALGFDPFYQGNLPQWVSFIYAKKVIDFLRIPSPTRQVKLQKVVVVEEFQGFLRELKDTQKKHLLIQLQDRLSWKEQARATVIENLSKHAEFKKSLVVITIPKQGDFYYQSGLYLQEDRVALLIKGIKEWPKREEASPFFFPSGFSLEDYLEFAEKVLPKIQAHFFNSSATLNRQARQDFIEIFLQLLVLKVIEIIAPTSLSFTCKDGVDISAAQVATFAGMIQLMTEEVFPDWIRWLLYAPAFFVRERAINPERLTRALSALETIDSVEGSTMKKAFDPLYKTGFLASCSVQPAEKASELAP